MIIGIGVDIVNISRIKKLVLKYNEKFLNRFFTDVETEYIMKKSMSYETISGIFSAKESISKVLGTGLRNYKLKDIEISHDENGKPIVKLYNNAKEISKNIGIEKIDISISHERDNAISFAIGYGEKRFIVDDSLRKLLPKREVDSHKGTYGRVGIIAGSKGMVGANYLSTMAALKTGSGLVYSIVPESILDIMSIKLIEAIIVPLKDKNGFFYKESMESLDNINNYNSIVFGPGIGDIDEIKYFLNDIIINYSGKILIDADGLNILSKNKDILFKKNNDIVLTPHPGEFSRLIGKSISEIELHRERYAMEFAKTYNIILVLKGNKTIVTNGKELYINNTGNPGMATAGSGDVLSGTICSLMGQNIDSLNASKLGVFLHGLAGDIAKNKKGEYGIIARDILKNIPEAMKTISQ